MVNGEPVSSSMTVFQAAQRASAAAAGHGGASSSFRSSMVWTQIFGLSSVLLGLYFSAEHGTGSGSTIALVAAIMFATVAVCRTTIQSVLRPKENR